MNIFSLALLILGIAYGGLTALSGSMQLSQKKVNMWAAMSMVLGGLLVIASVILHSEPGSYILLMLAAGLFSIHVAAINNGFKLYGRIHPKHHILRLAVSTIIITLYLLR